jgi:hypothetical protein
VHTPNYDFNDDAIPAGVDYWVSLVHQQLAADGASGGTRRPPRTAAP